MDECQWETCDQLCTNTEGSYICSCKDGYVQLEHDQRGCRSVDDPVLLVGTPQDLRLYRAGDSVGAVPALGVKAAYLDRGGDSFCYVHRNVTNASLVCRETAHPERARVLPSPRMFQDLSSTGALALDWVSGNLYLFDETREVVYVCRADGVRCRLVATDNLSLLRGLAVDPLVGFVFWTVWGSSRTALERALLDGSDRKPLVGVKAESPTALALDPIRRHVYWTEARRRLLVRTDYYGRRRHTVHIMHDAAEMRGMSLLHPTLYLPQWSEQSVRSVWVSSGRRPAGPPRDLSIQARPIFTMVAHPLSRPATPHHPCGTNNGGCEHLCITSYHESRPHALCVCSHGYRPAGRAACERKLLFTYLLFCVIS